MSEVLVILSHEATDDERREATQLATPTRAISDRVFAAECSAGSLEILRAAPGVERVLTGNEDALQLPVMQEGESLFSRGWLLSKDGSGSGQAS